MKQANIKVAVRIRPLIDEEVKTGQTSTKLEVDQENKCINVYNDRTSIYKNSQFDYVLDQNSTQRKVYDKVGITELVKAVVEGYHATIFAYGQTGSGKTFTMEGYKYKANDKGIPIPVIEQSEAEGIVPRAIYQLFDMIKKETNLQTKRFTVYCSYLQVYKEKIYDLLNRAQVKRLEADGPGLKLKWNKNDHFTVENLYTFECRSPDDVMALYHFGIRNKVVASHNMNNASSRSHTMLSLTVEQVDAKSPDNIITSKLQLVDLAGSERQSQTGTQANKESIDINKSLFTLRQVITALTDKKNQSGQNQYVPYRESKLTSLLRQSLGGNSYCLMIACLNPCDAYIDENISTLQYASKASFISNKPIKNDDPKMRLIEHLKKENKLLNEELSKANETIQFLSQITGNNPKTVQANLKNVQMPSFATPQELTNINKIVLGEATPTVSEMPPRQGSASSAITEKRGSSNVTDRIIKDKDNIEKFFKEKSETLQNIANINKPMNSNLPSSAVNESKDAITERIIHTVNMMKEVLQSNLSLRETIQKQSEMIDSLNAEIFQLQNENEDLRDRLQILEEYTGKDTYSDLTKLVKEKKVLENRVKHLEQTSMNWAQFQATRSQFHQSKDKIVNQSQVGLQPRATLDNQFNDDYEPVRCAINTTEDDTKTVLSDLNKFNNGSQSKKRKKVQQINFQKQFQRGKSIQPMQAVQFTQGDSFNPNDRHQEYKIRTVKSLAQAYQQQQQMHQQLQQQMRQRGQTTKANTSQTYQGRFTHQPSGLNVTYYEKHRNSLGFANPSALSKFNGNNTQELSYDDQNITADAIDQTRNRSPLIAQNSGKYAMVQKQQSLMEQANLNVEFFPKDLFNRDKNSIPSTQPHITLRKKEMEGQAVNIPRPPKSPNKYSSSHKKDSKRNNNINSADRERLNISADYINNSHMDNDPYMNASEHQQRMTYDNNTESDDQFYEYDDDNANEEVDGINQNADAYEALRLQKMKNIQRHNQQWQQQQQRSESGFGQLDVSLPMIK